MTFVGTLIGIGMTTSVHVHGPYLVGILNAAAATRAFSVNSRSRAVRIPQAAVLGNVPLKRHHRVHIQRSITVLASHRAGERESCSRKDCDASRELPQDSVMGLNLAHSM